MKVSDHIKSTEVDVSFEYTTLTNPGEKFITKVIIRALKKCKLNYIKVELPNVIFIESNLIKIEKELLKDEEYALEIGFYTKPKQEGFGEILYHLAISNSNSVESTVSWKSWISCYTLHEASDPEGLDDDFVHRLVDTVKARPRNGQISAAHPVAYLKDFCGIEVAPSIANIVEKSISLGEENLPVDVEQYYGFVTGRLLFYSVEEIEYIPYDLCNDSDPVFDTSATHETKVVEV